MICDGRPEQRGYLRHFVEMARFLFYGRCGGVDTLAKKALEALLAGEHLRREDFAALIRGRSPEAAQILARRAVELRKAFYGTDVYVRGLIELANCCKNN